MLERVPIKTIVYSEKFLFHLDVTQQIKCCPDLNITMSDFWEKNKGSITSGLKTAGKYGYQGTKYVAKTGYKASKTAGSRRQKGKGRRNKDEEDEEEDEVDEEKSNHNYNQTPPYGQYGGAQGYAGPPQQYQQSYQQPPQPYQQASQQYQSYPQPY